MSRRRRAALLLAIAGVLGMLLTTFAEKGSTPYDVGTVLMLACVTIGSFVLLYFAKKRAPVLAMPPSFAPEVPFTPHLRVRLAQVGARRAAGGAGAADGSFSTDRYYFLVGTEGFSARLRQHAAARDSFDAQLLRPEEALARFTEGTAFRVFDGVNIVATGAVETRVEERTDA